jgi:hypothetical protein
MQRLIAKKIIKIKKSYDAEALSLTVYFVFCGIVSFLCSSELHGPHREGRDRYGCREAQQGTDKNVFCLFKFF